MRDSEIPLAPDVDCRVVEQAIDHAISAVRLTTTLRGSLKKYEGCIHRHVKNGRASGTLEVTLWPQELKAWFTIQKGRRAPWIEGKMKLVREAIQEHLQAAYPRAGVS